MSEDTKIQILIIDDDPEICQLVQEYLQKHDFSVSYQHDGNNLVDVVANDGIDLVILDVMLPGDDGVTLCRKLRESSNVMILMLSAMGEDTDKIVGLEVGADDYLAKPFNPRELLARIKSLVRRDQIENNNERSQQSLESVGNIRFANWTLDRNKRQIFSDEREGDSLTTGEYELLLAFVENANRVLSRDQLLNITHNRDAGPYDRAIDVQIGRLRKKLEKDSKQPVLITTVRGGGYQFNAKVIYE